MFRSQASSWLTFLADPAGPSSGPPPKRPLQAEQLTRLWQLAELHGVLPAVVANISAAAETYGFGRIIATSASAQSPAEQLAAALAGPKEMLPPPAAMTLIVRRQATELAAAMAESSAPATILKGVDFADRLYPIPGFRRFGDVDILVPESALPKAERVLRDLGYLPKPTAMKYEGGYGQQSFCRDGAMGGPVEVHWNLINSPSVRRGISVAFDDLELLPPPAGQAGLPIPAPASVLLIAALHAAASHCFDRLQLLCDLCQAARGAAGEIDTDWLSAAARRTGSSLALSVALSVTGKILREPKCFELIRAAKLPRGLLWRPLLTRGVVLRRHARIDSFRRSLFREMLKKPR